MGIFMIKRHLQIVLTFSILITIFIFQNCSQPLQPGFQNKEDNLTCKADDPTCNGPLKVDELIFNENPMPYQTCSGQSFFLNASTNITDGVVFRWQFTKESSGKFAPLIDSNRVKGASTNRLVVMSSTQQDSGYYKLTAAKGSLVVDSKIVYVDINSQDCLSLNVTKSVISVNEGEQANFGVSVTSANSVGPYRCVLKKEDQSVTDCSGPGPNLLATILKAQTSNTGTYYIYVSDSNNLLGTAGPFTLTVNPIVYSECAIKTKSWGGGCQGSSGSILAHGGEVNISNNASGYTGSAKYRCNNGSLDLVSGSFSCNSLEIEGNKSCPQSTVSFDNQGVSPMRCEGQTPAGTQRHGDSFEVLNNKQGYGGKSQFRCNNGVWVNDDPNFSKTNCQQTITCSSKTYQYKSILTNNVCDFALPAAFEGYSNTYYDQSGTFQGQAVFECKSSGWTITLQNATCIDTTSSKGTCGAQTVTWGDGDSANKYCSASIPASEPGQFLTAKDENATDNWTGEAMFTCSVDKGWVVTNDNQWIIPKCKNVGPTKVWIYVGKDYINDGTLNGFPIYGDTCFSCDPRMGVGEIPDCPSATPGSCTGEQAYCRVYDTKDQWTTDMTSMVRTFYKIYNCQ